MDAEFHGGDEQVTELQQMLASRAARLRGHKVILKRLDSDEEESRMRDARWEICLQEGTKAGRRLARTTQQVTDDLLAYLWNEGLWLPNTIFNLRIGEIVTLCARGDMAEAVPEPWRSSRMWLGITLLAPVTSRPGSAMANDHKPQEQVRADLAGLASALLMGPLAPDEIIESAPVDTYLTGILWPRGAPVDGIDDDAGLDSGSDPASAVEASVPGYRAIRPCSIGITFTVAKEATITIGLGETSRYVPVELTPMRNRTPPPGPQRPRVHRSARHGSAVRWAIRSVCRLRRSREPSASTSSSTREGLPWPSALRSTSEGASGLRSMSTP